MSVALRQVLRQVLFKTTKLATIHLDSNLQLGPLDKRRLTSCPSIYCVSALRHKSCSAMMWKALCLPHLTPIFWIFMGPAPERQAHFFTPKLSSTTTLVWHIAITLLISTINIDWSDCCNACKKAFIRLLLLLFMPLAFLLSFPFSFLLLLAWNQEK